MKRANNAIDPKKNPPLSKKPEDNLNKEVKEK